MTEILSISEYQSMYSLVKSPEPLTIQLLAAANQLILKQLNWKIGESGTEFITTIKGRDKYFIDNLSATKITKFAMVNRPEVDFADRCHLIGEGKLLITPGVPEGTYQITYDAESVTWPEDLKLAVALTVQYWEKHEYRNDRTFGNESISFMAQNTGLPKHIMTIVNSNRLL